MSKKSRRTRRLADGSVRDTSWQIAEYERVMGQQKREEQERAALLEQGKCICHSRVIRTAHKQFRTIHDPNCPRYKAWMDEYVKVSVNPSGAAHAAAINEVDRVREEAIARADQAVTQTWREHADEMIERTARRLYEFTSEDVWKSGLRAPEVGSPDGDALGPAMRRAKDRGIIENTGRLDQDTERPQRHNNPKRIWRSLVYVDAVRPEE